MKIRGSTIALFSLFWIIQCAGTTDMGRFFEEPNDDGIIIVGNVIIENIDQEFSFQNWDLGAQVVILGKTDDGTTTHYTVTTDKEGYYFLTNVPAGQYVIKAVILPMFGGQPIKLVNDRNSQDSRFYRMRHPTEPIEFTAKWFPERENGHILNLGIMWLGLRAAQLSDISSKTIGEVLMAKFSNGIKGEKLYNYGYIYTRENPLLYFKNKHPNSSWWEL